MLRIKLGFIVGGAMMVYFGYQEWRLSMASRDVPSKMSCADLAAKGPGDNAHVELTDFLMCEQLFVYQTLKDRKDWERVWVPTVPENGAYHRQVLGMIGRDGKLNGPLPKPKDVKVIVKTDRVVTFGQLAALAGRKTLTGMVTNRVESLGSKERRLLASAYPGIDFSRCWIFEHERKPAGVGRVAGFGLGGAFLSALGCLWMSSGARSRSW